MFRCLVLFILWFSIFLFGLCLILDFDFGEVVSVDEMLNMILELVVDGISY